MFLDGVKFGVLSVTNWYLTGTNPKIVNYSQLNSFIDSDSSAGLTLPLNYAVVPTKRTGAMEGYTLGLGDCFAGAVVASLVRPEITQAALSQQD